MNVRIAQQHEHSARRHRESPSARDRRRLRDVCHRLAADGRSAGSLLEKDADSGTETQLAYHPDDEILAGLLAAGKSQTVKVLIRMPWGLGDAVQLGCVLQHLAKHRPQW